jgi:uncharacterized protein
VPDYAHVHSFTLRSACPGDLDAVLALNREWEHVMSPLLPEELRCLHDAAALHVVAVDSAGSILAFALAFGPGVQYDSPNYRWFDNESSDFLYIDRVAVSSAAQRLGLGDALYVKVFDFAREQGVSRVVCEFDIEPMNSASDAFHQRWGFVEVGTQMVGGGTKRVSLRERVIDRSQA